MKKYLFFSLFVFLYFYPIRAFAQVDCCSADGGNYACNNQTGQLYCRDGKISTTCTCQIPPTATPIPTATPVPSLIQPECPVNSSFDVTSQECTCNSGYVVSNNTCVSDSDYCWDQYGGNSLYDSSNQSCTCSQGYIWNSNNTSCISLNTYCQNSLGNDSYYNNSNNTCTCDQSYTVQNNQCQPATVQTSNSSIISQPIVTVMPIVPTIAKNFPITSVTPIKITPTQKPTPDKEAKVNLNLKNFVTVTNKKQNGLKQFFISVWNFIRGVFGFTSTNLDTSTYKLQSK